MSQTPENHQNPTKNLENPPAPQPKSPTPEKSSAPDTPKLTPDAPPTPQKPQKNLPALILALTTLVCAVTAGVFIFLFIQASNKSCNAVASSTTSAPVESSTSSETSGKNINTPPMLTKLTEKQSVNGPENTAYYLSDQTVFNQIATVSADRKTITVELCGAAINNYYPELSYPSSCNEYEFNFSQPVVDFISGGIGHDAGGAFVIFLLEDGTLEYTPLYTAAKNHDFRSYGKISGVSDVVRIENAGSGWDYDRVSQEEYAGGGRTILAFRSDGAFYDLSEILESQI